mmetsp:Transcript_39211/g.58255  ORF Transcript_39211/g.58255 Transcript_39211/m.58255 type:complete len:144 (+) Transcript_39211:731-1162(+)
MMLMSSLAPHALWRTTFGSRQTGMKFSLTSPYFYDPNSTEAYSLATREDDPRWSDFVQWTLWLTIYAEEKGITSSEPTEMPVVDLFLGPMNNKMFRFVVLKLGSYGEMHNRTVVVPHSGRNELNRGVPLLNPQLHVFYSNYSY